MIDFDSPTPNDPSKRQDHIVRAERLRFGTFFSPWVTAHAADVVPLESLVPGVKYADTATKSQLRGVVSEAQEIVNFAQQVDTDDRLIGELENYLQDPQTVERVRAIATNLSRIVRFLTGGRR
jgi:hypothetical protein